MTRTVRVDELRSSETACRFEGRDHGSPVSFFVTNHPAGRGVSLHRHPYAETFIVQAGSAKFMVDGDTIEARAGEVVVVPAGAVHGFVSSGDEPLRQVSIHPSDHVVQEWIEG